jgi:mycothiol system anti-sigma-R factor
MQRAGSEEAASRCAEIRRVVFEFLDRELAAPQAERVAEHLRLCGPCEGYYAFERTFLAVLRRRVPLDQAPEELRDRIRAALADRKRSGPPS